MAPLPRIHVRRPREGYYHPVGRADIERVLRYFGEECTYGLRSVELVRAGEVLQSCELPLGKLHVPGRILIFEQPSLPWLLPGTLPPGDREKLLYAGAVIGEGGQTGHTLICWPGTTLRDFMLFDVLMHEVGHHLIQQYKGKRRARVMRTKDHEAFAESFARQCRLDLEGHGSDL